MKREIEQPTIFYSWPGISVRRHAHTSLSCLLSSLCRPWRKLCNRGRGFNFTVVDWSFVIASSIFAPFASPVLWTLPFQGNIRLVTTRVIPLVPGVTNIDGLGVGSCPFDLRTVEPFLL